MGREIKLTGGEIRVLKSLGTSGSPVSGKLLLENVDDFEKAEFVETLSDLVAMGYIVASKVNVRSAEEAEKAYFRVSPAHAHELRLAMHPSKRREEQRARRERRG